MPLTARTVAGAVVYAAFHRLEVAIVCRDCGGPMHYRRRNDDPPRVAHFAHNPHGAASGPRACSGETTPEHDNAKTTLLLAVPDAFDALAGALGQPEQDIAIPDTGRVRRADVLFGGTAGRHPVAFEAQFSKISFAANRTGRSVEERTADYHAAGVHVVWCFPDKRTAQEYIAAARRVYGCVGLLSPDGTEVTFQGVNALWLDKHPAQALRERADWRHKQAAQRAPRKAAVGAPLPASTSTITDEMIDHYFARAQEPLTLEQSAHLVSLDQRMHTLREQPPTLEIQAVRVTNALRAWGIRLPVRVMDCITAYDRLGHAGLYGLLLRHGAHHDYGKVANALFAYIPEIFPAPGSPLASDRMKEHPS